MIFISWKRMAHCLRAVKMTVEDSVQIMTKETVLKRLIFDSNMSNISSLNGSTLIIDQNDHFG